MGTSVFLSSGDGYLGEIGELQKRCQEPFCISRGNVRYLSRHCSGKGPHFALKGESRGFSRVAAGRLGFLSSCNRDLRGPLVLPQESQVSMQVARGLSGFLLSWFRGLGPHLVLRLEPQASSAVLTWILEFLWSFNKGVRPQLVWKHGTPVFSRGIKVVSGFLLT